jgi:hypothetical protein
MCNGHGMPSHSFRNLKVWNDAMALAEDVYRAADALGSQGEVETQIELARRLKFLTADRYRHLQGVVEENGRMLNGLIDSLEIADRRGSES